MFPKKTPTSQAAHMQVRFSEVATSQRPNLTCIVFAGHDASKALGKTSTKPEDVSHDWSGLSEKEKGVLDDWYTFFSKRYNIVGVVQGASNL